MLDFVKKLPNVQELEPLKSLSGLNLPVLRITASSSDYDRKVAILTARVHPGESNSSFVMEGIL